MKQLASVIWLYFKDIGELWEWLKEEGLEELGEKALDFHDNHFGDELNTICLGYLVKVEGKSKITIIALSLTLGREPRISFDYIRE
jgi:hypothetical protein